MSEKTLTELAREINYQPTRYEAYLETRLAEAEAAITDARTNLGALSPSCFKAEQWIGEKAQATWVALDNYHFKHLRTADSASVQEDVSQ